MSFGDLYTAPPGSPVAGNAPGLPPIDLPKSQSRPRTTVTVHPLAKEEPEISPWALRQPEHKDTSEAEPEVSPWASKQPAHTEELDRKIKEQHAIGTGEAIGRGFADTATFGLSPALQGALQVGQRPDESEGAFGELRNVIRGLYKLVEGDPETVQAYRQARDEERQKNEEAFQQHPIAYGGGALAGGLASPSPIKLGPATFLGRVGRGALAGGVSGGMYGAGSAVSKGEDAGQALQEIAGSAGAGTLLGGAIHGVIGPRVVNPAGAGQAAARTAEKIGAPIPRGFASDNPNTIATTAKLRSLPFVGAKINTALGKTQKAAGGVVEDIAQQMAGGPTDRSIADAIVRPGLRGAIQQNKKEIDQAYNSLRGMIDPNRPYTLPTTTAALTRIMQARSAAGWSKPELGLDQFLNLIKGATFNGAHRARADAREAGNVTVPHPGYNNADFNKLTRALTRDLRNIVDAEGGPPALQAFDDAEQTFGRLSEQNDIVHSIAESKGEAAIATLLKAANEKGGDLRLLAQLRNTMSPSAFQNVAGTLLSELGHNNSTGEFSLAKFATGWDKVSDNAKRILFSPQHLSQLEEIFGLGQHLKDVGIESNVGKSGTAGPLILLDMAKDAVLIGVDLLSGGVGAGTALGGATTAAAALYGRWLASPATAASMSRWVTAYRAVTLNTPTPARRAAFNIATRNLANTLGVPAEAILQRAAQGEAPRQAESRAAPAAAKSQSRAPPQSLGR